MAASIKHELSIAGTVFKMQHESGSLLQVRQQWSPQATTSHSKNKFYMSRVSATIQASSAAPGQRHLWTLSPETSSPKGQPSPPGYPSKEAPSRKRNKTKVTETTAESKTLQFELEAISTCRTAFQAETWSQSDSFWSHHWLPRWLGEITLFSLRPVCTEEVIIMELCTG